MLDDELISKLMIQLNVAGDSKFLAGSGDYTKWFGQAISQILVLTGEDDIITVGHTLEAYNVYDVKRDEDDTATGKFQVLTDKLLIVTEFQAPSHVTTTAYPLRDTTSVTIREVQDTKLRRRDGQWPEYVTFQVEVAGKTFNFPPGVDTSSYQTIEIPAAFKAVMAALTQG
ncbi:hypothetical protein [Arthrobacter sp. StoSoilB22]|uniref:hypothetical protein n=1 Tax=Arthrobacter sp. StoSoilB22 TaxID=2830996 RepID=UPI001CC3A301|nr:hypothetical protein [Arthrobacter sp. StoSoilB22]BCW61786.1 hypothetical protein StoSoilB22_07590 [Arthrobacter sp. StoSoilB22]